MTVQRSLETCTTDNVDSLRALLLDQVESMAIALLQPDGTIVSWNRGAEKIFGWPVESIVGQSIDRVCISNAAGDGFTHDLIAAAEKPVNGERSLQRNGGATFWASWELTLLKDRSGNRLGFALVLQDVTDRRRHADSLRQMVEQSLNALVLVNAQGNIATVNTQAERLFGYPREQLIGKPVELLVPQRFQKDHIKNREAYFAHPMVRPMGAGRDLYGRRSDGSEFPVEIGLSPVETATGPAVLGSIVDITERKRADKRFRLAVESAPNAMVIINRDGRIVLVNLQTERLFGYTREELLGESVELLVPDRYRDRHPAYRAAFFLAPVVRTMGAGRDLFGRRKDGSEFPVEIGLNPIETGEETLVLSAIVDITARKHAEEQVRKHLADLAHVARLSTVGQMFSELAHEINQPLGAAANYARACVSFSKSKGATPEQLSEWMEKIAEQTTRAIEIVKRLGSFVKKDGGARTVVDINRIVEQVVASSVPVRTPSSDGATVELDLFVDPSIPPICVDRVQIEQVLLNLTRNGVEAMLESASAVRKLTLRTSHDAEHVYVTVADTGPGISADNYRRLFEPYFTTKSGGMGLGLSISRSIVEDHNGRLDVETSPRGTTFRFSLPKRIRD